MLHHKLLYGTVHQAAAEMIEIARREHDIVTLTFNGVELVATEQSYVDAIVADYFDRLSTNGY